MSEIHAKQRGFWYCCLIFLIGGVIYANSLHNSFIFDDEIFIVRNLSIHHLLNFKAINSVYPHRFFGTLTFALNYAICKLDAQGYHAVNILIHILCGLFVWWFVVLILSTPRFLTNPLAMEKEKLGFWAAVLFITHPVQTMAVDQIAQRYTLLAALFYFMSLCFYFKGRISSGSTSRRFLILTVVAGGVGIYCRETFITLPLAVIMSEVLILKSESGFGKKLFNSWLYWIPLVVVLGLILALYHFNFSHVFNAHYPSQSHQGETINAFNYFLTQSRVMMIYIRLLFWPIGLNFDYDIKLSHTFWDPSVLISFGGIVMALISAWCSRFRYPLLSFGIFWFFLTLSIESTFIPINYVIAEYRLYLPLFGFCVAFVFMARVLIQNRKVFLFFMCAIVLMFSFLTIQRNIIYKNDLTLWSDTILKSPDKSRAYSNLAAAYMKDHEYEEAFFYLGKTLNLDPNDNMALNNLAVLYAMKGDLDKAINIDEKLLRIEPLASLYNNLGKFYRLKGDWDQAEQYFLMALKSDTIYQCYVEVKLNLAEVYFHKGQVQQSIKACLQVLSQYPDESRASHILTQLYLQTNQLLPTK